MVTLHVYYILNLFFKVFCLWLSVVIVVGIILYVKKTRKWLLYATLLTLICAGLFLVHVFIQKAKITHFLYEKEGCLVNAKMVRVELKLYDQTGEINKSYKLSTKEVRNIIEIFSINDLQVLPRLGPPSSANRIRLFCDEKRIPLLVIYEKKIMLIEKYSFELTSTRLWDCLIDLSQVGEDMSVQHL